MVGHSELPRETLFAYLSSFFFLISLLHSFLAGKISQIGHRFSEGSIPENIFHLLGEVEIIFGLWSGVWILFSILFLDFQFVMNYLDRCNFNEALFIFVIMATCSTRPLLRAAESFLLTIAKILPIPSGLSTYLVILFIGPLLGSFITEPAAMTICAFLLRNRFFTPHHSDRFKYATLALLFVNVSLGGTLTPFAAPPILMVASKWNWDLLFMLKHFAPKTILSLALNTAIMGFLFRNEIQKKTKASLAPDGRSLPFWLQFFHIGFLVLIVMTAHYPILFVGIFLFFIGFLRATHEYQNNLQLREPLLVGFFLGGLVILGGPQSWWLQPLVAHLSELQLYYGAISLTAFTDNATLTYLGSLIENLSPASQYALGAGSVIGGGMTLIANAPNPAGYGILRESFEKKGFNPLHLALAALPLTLLAAFLFKLF